MMICRRCVAWAVVLLALSCVGEAGGLEIAPLRHTVDASSGAYVPYAASHSFTEENRAIRRILFSIHSSGFDALQYYDNALQAASQVRGAVAETLIVAPQFFERSVIPGAIPEGMLFWTVSPYRGSSRGSVGPDAVNKRISAYAVVDAWLESLTTSGAFPGVEEIVLVGHSAGGQFVQRYAMIGKFRAGDDVQMRYVVSAPSSYAYTSGERYHAGQRRFVLPDAATIKKCPGYNHWGYGLDKPYAYFADSDLDAIAKDFAEKRVFYLCGSKDSNPNDESLGKSCGAMMQGLHRLQRMQIYAGFLEFKYGKAVLEKHRFAVVPNVGHYGRGTMTSAAGLHALFGRGR